jgi:hypothetical protein
MREVFTIKTPRAKGNSFNWRKYRKEAIERMDNNIENRIYKINKRILTNHLKKN